MQNVLHRRNSQDLHGAYSPALGDGIDEHANVVFGKLESLRHHTILEAVADIFRCQVLSQVQSLEM
jgi:hypothetical protein